MPNKQGTPAVGFVHLGDLRRLEPLTRSFGYDRGQPIDRYYIEKFLRQHAGDISGHVVEIGDDRYTRKFGGKGVTRSEVLDQARPDSSPTIIADLTSADNVPSNSFDCIIITQTLQFIYDVHAAVRTLHRILNSGGILLGSIPALSPICRYDMDRWGDYWRFTSAAVQRLFGDLFGFNNVHVEANGNVLVAAAFFYGMATEELTKEELDFNDRDFEVLITVRAVKS
ncbi:MAG: methyltransferase domain-containing protein [Bacteroidota bacterium]|nr:methyltransferase domain-containing protein [Flavisolibacter sp.]MDQ3845767.1 methyltransferase domain-containing protein [Bacteroidota bacterium]